MSGFLCGDITLKSPICEAPYLERQSQTGLWEMTTSAIQQKRLPEDEPCIYGGRFQRLAPLSILCAELPRGLRQLHVCVVLWASCPSLGRCVTPCRTHLWPETRLAENSETQYLEGLWNYSGIIVVEPHIPEFD